MKVRLSSIPILFLLPLILGGIGALILQANPEINPIFAVNFRLDLGTATILGGGLISLTAIIARLFRRRSERWELTLHKSAMKDALESRLRFLHQLDHELKNPLTALRMEIAYLSGEETPSEYLKVYTDMQTQIDRITRLLADLRKLAQLEEQELLKLPLAIDEVLHEVLEAAQDHPNYAERDVRLTLLSHPLRLAKIRGDRGLLWLACFNLLDNALKFTPPGAQVEMRAFEVAPWLVLEVADDGPGIAESDQPHVFEELYRGENARSCPGSGLGLALVRTIASLHDGSISVRSRPGQGTVFTLRLPSVT